MNGRLLPLILPLLLAACASSDPVPGPDRPGADSPAAPDDYSEILADPRVRFQNDTLSLVFDDGGILYSSDRASVHRFVRLDPPLAVTFDPSRPSLRVDSRDARIDTCILAGADGPLRFYLLLPSREILVVEQLPFDD